MSNGSYDNSFLASDIKIVASGDILKWTNYVHGWQVRYFQLSSDGFFSYYLSGEDLDCSRGSVNIQKMILQIHKHSEVRFDIVTPGVTWYMRCLTPEDRTSWLSLIEKQQLDLPMAGSDTDTGSVRYLTESGLQVVSDLNMHLDELKSFKDSLSKQLAAIRIKLNQESPELSEKLATVQATVSGIVATTANCIDIMQERENSLQDKINAEKEKTRHIEILYKATHRENNELIKNNIQQGPHLNEDEFYDAVESTLDRMEEIDVQKLQIDDKSDDSSKKSEHWMSKEMQGIIEKYLELSKQDPENDPSWAPLSKDGPTKIYRKEELKDNLMIDFLVATTTVQGVTAGEMASVFHTQELKLKWDHTIEADKLLETLDEHCAVFHQILKRVWPSTQRDMVYASHKQQITDGKNSDWIVVNKSCDHPARPEGTYCRATVEVVLYCKTICDKPNPTRADIKTQIVYSATVNPGGWAPASAVRAISQREYPKFLKKISSFAQDHVKKSPIQF